MLCGKKLLWSWLKWLQYILQMRITLPQILTLSLFGLVLIQYIVIVTSHWYMFCDKISLSRHGSVIYSIPPWSRPYFYHVMEFNPYLYISFMTLIVGFRKKNINCCWVRRAVCEGKDSPGRVWPKTKMGSLWNPVWRCASMYNTMTGPPCVCILWRGGVSCPVSAAWHSCEAAHWCW